MFSLEAGVDFRPIWAEKIMFSLEPGVGAIFGRAVRPSVVRPSVRRPSVRPSVRPSIRPSVRPSSVKNSQMRYDSGAAVI